MSAERRFATVRSLRALRPRDDTHLSPSLNRQAGRPYHSLDFPISPAFVNNKSDWPIDYCDRDVLLPRLRGDCDLYLFPIAHDGNIDRFSDLGRV